MNGCSLFEGRTGNVRTAIRLRTSAPRSLLGHRPLLVESKMDKYRALEDTTFMESYLVGFEYAPWPHTIVFYVWSTHRKSCYRITAKTVLELHYESCYVDPFNDTDLLLMSITIARNEDHRFWNDRVRLLTARDGGDDAEPICLVFDSHVFSGRRHNGRLTTQDIGMLVVCRDFDIERVAGYEGPRPFPHNIPSSGE